MKVLVVYGTKSGCTTGIAEQIGRTLAEKGASVDVISAEEAGRPAEYDAVVVGSGVRVGTWHQPARAWVSDNASVLRSRPTAFFTCGLTIAEGAEKADEVRGYTDKVIEETGVTPVDIGLFAGWNEPKSFTFVERGIMKMMKAPQGDFRDMAAVAEWTGRLAPQLGVLQVDA
jgi:menaquinone-dependent protoporphyrinogen oxidase